MADITFGSVITDARDGQAGVNAPAAPAVIPSRADDGPRGRDGKEDCGCDRDSTDGGKGGNGAKCNNGTPGGKGGEGAGGRD